MENNKYNFNKKIVEGNKMFYSEYSDYSPEQLITPIYEEVTQKLLNMADNDSIRENMERNIVRRWV